MDDNMRDIEYGIDKNNFTDLTYNDIDGEEFEEEYDEQLNEVKTSINEEAQGFEACIIKDIENAEFLSKKEKSIFLRIVSKRIRHAIKEFSNEADEAAKGSGVFLLDDIGSELDDVLDKIKKSVDEMLDVDSFDYGYGYSGIKSNINHYNTQWPKSNYCAKPAEIIENDYSSGMKEIDSDRKIKIKIDKDSLDCFLSESDGDNENIGMITGENREFSDIEDIIFKIVKIESDIKKRQGAYTEADGKAISDYAMENNLVKCGWIHTHPFTKNATFFSSLDKRTTREMCVLPDDYCLAVVVGCEYKEVNNYMKDDGKIVKEFDIQYNLGRMTYRKVQLANEIYDKKTDLIPKEHRFVMVKYDCNIIAVDKDGNNVEEF